jgi:hypothetical protein
LGTAWLAVGGARLTSELGWLRMNVMLIDLLLFQAVLINKKETDSNKKQSLYS